ncbi:SDR family NAD(P)-dependent oxidoreductase [Helcobacillus massiliensis]|uniref:SDR family NAD(P)-dependent oxidoreductase n=1 Tax=Helcobacillus TaxID=1161125 RepID=UPI001EF709E0|nr:MULTISPECIES: SDR family NAD(P)-dependent oxidoreductase [Helcobacillus]MCG7426122.1 SDR family NAD(P)-dependent oxidoreductase [Helcobacillus sp. ACRRO]MCT1557745.1 SDR family NAD(P)-dependent oxidoreductase [Helcobacillus massiliensis]MCT2036017.1 SDR family NAD(P)-dependent oxidoreductase [Helcobacillus massiliensis]MCT2331713.1 SDR family NAD(P)-dependent oxidoreductase [Helcobacillus massiliensis]
MTTTAPRHSSRTLPYRPLVVVTGASAGIGEAIARRFAAEGARVVLLARRADRLDTLVAEIGRDTGRSGDVDSYAVDLADAGATADVCRAILHDHGTPDVLINNAGAGRFLSIEETSVEEAHAQMDLPYFAAFHMTRGLIEPMIARGRGVVFQINSPVAITAWPGAVGYAAARGAIRGFTAALRQDLHGTGVRVGSLTPTRVHSDYFDANPDSVDRVPKVEALVGTMTPEEVAETTLRAVRTRPGRDSFAPWRWSLFAPVAAAVPAPFEWLFRVTGHKRVR